MSTDVWLSVAGLLVALFGGHLAVWWTLKTLRDDYNTKLIRWDDTVFLGSIERLFFSVATAFNLSGIAIGMVAWIAAKMAANWSSVESTERYKKVVHREATMSDASPDEEEAILDSLFTNLVRLRFSALIAGLVSMLFALVGALIATRGQLGSAF